MKKIICSVLLLLSCASLCSAQIRSQVDERTELTTVVFRLAGMPEFVNNEVSAYTQSIDTYFAKYKEHELIGYVQSLRSQYGLAYAAIAGSATKIHINGKGVTVNPDITYEYIAQIDGRWSKETFSKYVALLNDFYKKTKFKNFFEANKEIYSLAEQEMNALLAEINAAWFHSFFGMEFVSPNVYVAVANGRNNYIVDDPGTESGYGIVIGCGGNGEGMPHLDQSAVSSVIIHEICHFFTEPLFVEYWSQMENGANIIYPVVQEKMRWNAYGSAKETMVEWLNNLFKIMYFKENPNPYNPVNVLVSIDSQRGFIWMQRAVRFMDNFYNNRSYYKYVDSFMPQIAGFVEYTAANFDKVISEYEHRSPYVMDIFPAPGKISDIKDAINEIRVTFSEPMATYAYGYNKIDGSEYPLLPIEKVYWENENTFVLKINPLNFEEGKAYGIRLDQYYFLNESNYPLNENVEIIYN